MSRFDETLRIDLLNSTLLNNCIFLRDYDSGICSSLAPDYDIFFP
jgi:hypothetical protein